MVHAQTLLLKLSEFLPDRAKDPKFRETVWNTYPDIRSPRDAAKMLLAVIASKQASDIEGAERIFVDCDRSEKPIKLYSPVSVISDDPQTVFGFLKESFKRSNIVDLIDYWIGNWQPLEECLRALERVTEPPSRSSIAASIDTSKEGARVWVRVECADRDAWFSMPVLYVTRDADHSSAASSGAITDQMIIEVGKLVRP